MAAELPFSKVLRTLNKSLR
ncbi:hypothetical protein TYRP_017585 [Tyrophagus putrescentiae]|nr:hypothetical protein TYRP_017585 [Tyrophagus putrescentiae]